MAAALVDHLWQSVLTFAVLWLGAGIASRNAAVVRLWMWRIAALKFIVPFHVLFAFGRWFGYPVTFSIDDVPPMFATPVAWFTPFFTPAQVRGLDGWALGVSVALLLAATLPCARIIHEHLRLERSRSSHETERLARDPDDREPGLGFVRGLAFAAVTLLAISGPVLGGAIEDHRVGRELLEKNARALRDADVVMKEAEPGMGDRMRIRATSDGVFIRNATVQELAGLAYGVNRFMVRGQHFVTSQKDDWLIGERYDITIAGRIVQPERFDTYALRRPVTRMLANRYGYELYLNGDCQPPCGRYGVPMSSEGL